MFKQENKICIQGKLKLNEGNEERKQQQKQPISH